MGIRKHARPGIPKKLVGFRDQWLDEGACVKERTPPAVFDTEEPNFPYLREALLVCGRCSVTNECLTYAIKNMPSYTGVVGNQMFWYGEIVRKMPITSRYGRRIKNEYHLDRKFSR